MEDTRTVDALVARIEDLERRLAARGDGEARPADDGQRPTTRRMLLLGGAALGAGLVASLAPGEVALANDPDDLTLGQGKATASRTRADYTGSGGGNAAFLFQAGTAYTGDSSAFPCVLAGWTTTAANPHAIYGYTTAADGHGVVGLAKDGHGVHGQSTDAEGVFGIGGTSGVRGAGAFAGLWGDSEDGHGVVAITTNGFGVSATSTNSYGVNAAGGTYGVQGLGPTAGVYGVSFVGRGLDGVGVDGVSVDAADYAFRNRTAGKAVLLLSSAIRGGGEWAAPRTRTDVHVRGEVDIDANGDLWLCTVAGTPGTWRKLSGPTVAGAFHAVTPGRVYDSRVPDPGPLAPLAVGQERTIDVAGRRQLTTGTVELADFVPAGATAIAANVSVVDTVSAGFLTANPGGVHSIGAATINWSASGQILNNGVILTLDDQRRLNVIAGGSPGASTHFVVDVTGYFL